MPALTAFLFGITIAIAVGPIALLIMHFGITHGLRTAAGSAAGAALADLSYALVAFLAGAAVLPRLLPVQTRIEWLAALVLCALGLRMVLRALRGSDAVAVTPRVDPGRALAATYALTVVNPLTMVAFFGLALRLPLRGAPLQSVGYAFALFAGSLLVQLLFAFGGALLRPLAASPRALRVLQAASGAGILLFGITGIPWGTS